MQPPPHNRDFFYILNRKIFENIIQKQCIIFYCWLVCSMSKNKIWQKFNISSCNKMIFYIWLSFSIMLHMCLQWIYACSSQYFKKDISQNSREIWNLSESNCTLTHNRLDPKQIIKYLPKMVVWSFLPSVSCVKSHCDDMNFKFPAYWNITYGT